MRTLWTFLASMPATFFYAFQVRVHAALKTKRFREVADNAPMLWSKAVLRAAGVRVVVEGYENFCEGQAQVLIANHASWFDVFALASVLPPGFRFVAKNELRHIPIFGPTWIAAGHYPVDRSNRESAIASLNRAGASIREGKFTLVMFAEGTRAEGGTMGAFKKGQFVLAISAEIPIAPVAIIGSRDIMAKGRWRVHPGTVIVRFGKPISTEGLVNDDRDRLTALAFNAVAGLAGEDVH